MKIPAEFEEVFRGIDLTERENGFLIWITEWDQNTIRNMRTVLEKVRAAGVADGAIPQPSNEPLTPYPDGDTSIIACPHCGSGEYLHNEDGNEQNYCGQCGQAIDWSRPPEGEADA